jgi:hypothetical protein
MTERISTGRRTAFNARALAPPSTNNNNRIDIETPAAPLQ